jgi:hypothetical protein
VTFHARYTHLPQTHQPRSGWHGSSRIPKGFWPKAQGCCDAVTLGPEATNSSSRNVVVAVVTGGQERISRTCSRIESLNRRAAFTPLQCAKVSQPRKLKRRERRAPTSRFMVTCSFIHLQVHGEGEGHNRVAVDDFVWRRTQGRLADSPTLGFEAQSL